VTGVLPALLATAAAAYLGAAFVPRRGDLHLGPSLAAAGAAAHAAALGLAWVAAGHGPFLTPFEVLSAKSFLLAAATVALTLRDRRLAALGRVAFPLASAMVVVALAAGPQAMPLPLPMSSFWLQLHEIAYDLAFAALALTTALAVLQARGAREVADVDPRRWAGVGLALWTAGMLLGSVWGYDTGGRFWSWDPIEIWALVAWLVLGAHLHALRLYAPGPRARAWLQLGAFAVAAFVLFAAPHLGVAGHTPIAGP
jgi:ABC-type transport system involved in cytochrome c biogenesis permease subunit